MKNRVRFAVLPIAILLFGSMSVYAGPAPSDLQSEPRANLLGLHLNEYAFRWAAAGQESFRILVASDESILAADVGDLWDSGRRDSRQPAGVLYRGKAIGDGSTVWWKVKVRNAEGEESAWSEPARIEVPAAAAASQKVRRRSGVKGPKPEYVEGKLGQAIRMGSDGPVIWGEDYPALRPVGGCTIAGWIKPEKVGDEWQCIFRKEDGNDRRLLAIGKDGPHWGVWCGFGIGGKYVEFGAPYDREKLGDGKWHHVAVSFDGTHLRLYVDGVQIGQRREPGALGRSGSAAAYLGSHNGGRERLVGGLDEVRVYGEGLGADEMKALATGTGQVRPGALVAHWKFDGSLDNEATFTPDVVGNRVVFLGGTLISRMDKYGYLEGAITSHWPHQEITFRNLGWPADDVRGTARSEFGSAHNTQSWQPPKGERGYGFEKLKRQLDRAQPTTMIVGYGGEAAFADGAEEMEAFENDYRAMIGELEKSGANLVLLTPLRSYRHGKVLPDPAVANERLGRASKFILALAKEREHRGIDLFDEAVMGPMKIGQQEHPWFENGVHLNQEGYRRLARIITQRLVVVPGFHMASHVKREGEVSLPNGGAGRQGNMEKSRRGVRFDFTRDELPPLVYRENRSARGNTPRVWIDGEEAGTEAGKRLITSGPDFEQAERLRRVIVEKNRFHRYRLNPINKAYIFLFRRHEMGHLAYEMDDFDDLIRGKEQAIANLRLPGTHRYEYVYPLEWKAPRDYPDHEVPKDIPAPNVAAELNALKVADGFEVNLFAQNPMIFNPINLNWDRHGRAWVATSSTYPHIVPGRIPNDRIVILEDTDRDGVADRHTVFAEGLTVPHSVMPVTGGAYVCSTTELLFLADVDGDDRADSSRVVFSGFGNADVHHMIHGLRWSPWGDLFFTQSIYINSFVETPHGPRRLNGSGIWRFRPETERLDVFARGMVNPWGLALDDWGRAFGTDGAGGSGPHDVFPGSAFRTAAGAPRVMDGLIPGKPKNTAAEFLSGRHIPSQWAGSMLGNDFRANRTVRYQLEEKGSGFTAKEVETVLHSSHRSFRPVDIKMGPDGAVYVVDWYNPIIDHGEVDFHHPLRDKSHGRIWRITASGRPLVEPPRIADATVDELLDHLKAPEQYTRTQANRELVRREVSATLVEKWVAGLDGGDPDIDHHRLEALWLLTALNEEPPDALFQLTTVADSRIRAAAVRIAGRSGAGLDRLAVAVEDEHPRVRLAAVNALRGLGSLAAANLALRALDYEVDGNLDYALEMTVRDTREQWLPAMQAGKKVFDGKANRLSYALKKVNDPRAIEALVNVVNDGELQGEDLANAVGTVSALGKAIDLGQMLLLAKRQPLLLASIAEGAQYNSEAPTGGKILISFLSSDDVSIRIAAAKLAGSWNALATQFALLERAEKAETAPERFAMTRALAKIGARSALQSLWSNERPAGLRAAATAAQAEVDPKVASELAARVLPDLDDALEGRALFEAFLSREDGPALLAKALAGVRLKEAVAVEGARLASASGRQVDDLLAALRTAGQLKAVSPDLSQDDRRALLAEAKSQGSAPRGQQIYERAGLACTACHLVNGKGGRLGPDLSTVGSYMTPESLLESVLNPSTDIKQGYETVIVTKKDGALISGLLQRKTDTAALVRDPSGTVVSIPAGEITKVDTSPVSLMPPGLTSTLRRDELVDLMAYLTSLGK